MPDLHPYFHDAKEAFLWFHKMADKIVEAGKEIKRSYQVVIEVPSEKVYQEYKEYIEQIPASLKQDVLVNILEDGHDRYWVVNVDFKIIDKLGQAREIACIQVDIGNAPRLGIKWLDDKNQAKHPVIIHSAIPGGIERYLYAAMDDFKVGLPLWLLPVHIRLVPVGKEYVEKCRELVERLKDLPLRIEIDDRDISVSSRLKRAYQDFVPHKAVIGQQEVDNGCKDFLKIVDNLAKQMKGKPFIAREWVAEVSRQA